jgi:hypothetical protein
LETRLEHGRKLMCRLSTGGDLAIKYSYLMNIKSVEGATVKWVEIHFLLAVSLEDIKIPIDLTIRRYALKMW